MKSQQAVPTKSVWSEMLNFIIHLRWHYQLFILSGGFLLGGFMSGAMNWQLFFIQFANVHLLLFGGVTAYNSYWDKDKGPVGGLKNPPPMARWMRSAALLVQIGGLWIAGQASILFVIVYITSIILFWLYSTPLFRWKNSPHKSLIAIGISTGANAVLLGYLAAGNSLLKGNVIIASIGVMFIILSLYPASQLYQVAEDASRGDRTFARSYGKKGVTHFFMILFTAGIIITGFTLAVDVLWIGIVFCLIGIPSGITIWGKLKSLTGTEKDYFKIMRIKYGAALLFLSFVLTVLLMKHADIELF